MRAFFVSVSDLYAFCIILNSTTMIIVVAQCKIMVLLVTQYPF